MSESILRGDPTARELSSIGSSLHLVEGPFVNLDWLAELGERLTSLTITGRVEGSIDAINSLRGLELLRVWAYPKVSSIIELERLPCLEIMAVHGSVRIEWRCGGGRLRELTVESPPSNWREHIEKLPRLVNLGLARSKFVPTMFSGGIESLDISMMSWPIDARDIRGVHDLVSVDLTSVKRIADLSPFSNARGLTTVCVEDCPDFRSLTGAPVSVDARVILIGKTPARKTWKA